MSRHIPKFRVFSQPPGTENLIILIAEMRCPGDDKIQGWTSLPEKFIAKGFIVEQQAVVVQGVFPLLLPHSRKEILITDIFLVAQRLRENTPAVKCGRIVVKYLGAVALFCQQTCQRLIIGVCDIIKGIAACTAEEGAGVKAELRVKGADAAVGRCIQICKVDTLLHKTVDRRRKLPQHPVVHGLHQHNNDIFPGQNPCHFIGFLLLLPGKPCMNLLFCFLLSATVARGQGIDPVGIDILGHGLIQSANLIQPMGVKHILIRSLCRLHTAIVGLRIADGIVCFKYGLGKQQSSHSGQSN